MPYQDAFCIFLDDAILELVCLINQRPASERRVIQPTPLPPSAKDDILNALEASDCLYHSDYFKTLVADSINRPEIQACTRVRNGTCSVSSPYPLDSRHSLTNVLSYSFYEDLGAVEDMSASMIVDAYQHQVQADPSRAPRYLNCLKAIGTLRGGEDWEIIDQAVQFAYSEGRYTDDDVAEAYRYFGHEDPNLTEEAIIGKFYAFLGSTNQETEVRRQMWIIAQDRGSERIKAASEDREWILIFTASNLLTTKKAFPRSNRPMSSLGSMIRLQMILSSQCTLQR